MGGCVAVVSKLYAAGWGPRGGWEFSHDFPATANKGETSIVRRRMRYTNGHIMEPKKSRFHKLMYWVGFSLALLFLISMKTDYGWRRHPVQFELSSGCFVGSMSSWKPGGPDGFFSRQRNSGTIQWYPMLYDNRYGTALVIPLWIIIAGGMFAALIHDRKNRLPVVNHCACEYDLTGNESGVCPECGTAVKATEYAELAGRPR